MLSNGVAGPLLVMPRDKEATTSEMTAIAIAGFNCIMLMQETKVGLTIPILFSTKQSS